MTWTVKIRGDASAPIAAEYECPEHGRFEVTMPRDRLPHAMPCLACDASSPWRFPMPGAVRVPLGAVAQGKSDARPSEDIVMDTRPLADGMPLHEFRERRKKIHRDLALRHARSLRTR